MFLSFIDVPPAPQLPESGRPDWWNIFRDHTDSCAEVSRITQRTWLPLLFFPDGRWLFDLCDLPVSQAGISDPLCNHVPVSGRGGGRRGEKKRWGVREREGWMRKLEGEGDMFHWWHNPDSIMSHTFWVKVQHWRLYYSALASGRVIGSALTGIYGLTMCYCRLGLLGNLLEGFDPTSTQEGDVAAIRDCIYQFQKSCGLQCNHRRVLCQHTIAFISKRLTQRSSNTFAVP